MLGPSDPSVRQPVVAAVQYPGGGFYPADERQCRSEVKGFLYLPSPDSEKRWFGAVVPHAGWICSGAVAGRAIATLAAQSKPDIVVIFGAVHTPVPITTGALDSHQRWATPLGEAKIAADLQQKLLEKGNVFVVDARAHMREHAIEVVLPMVMEAWPNVPIVPIEVPPLDVAETVGRKTAAAISETGLKAVYLASSDLTHYGPNYGFTPAGVGPAAMEWTKDNDRRLLRLISELATDRIVPESRQRYNACGAGAIAAMLAACKASGATTAKTLWHTTSYETLAKVYPQPPHNAVGYAAVVVG